MVGSLISSLPLSLLWRRGGWFVDFSALFVFAVACGDLWVFVRSVLEDLGFLWVYFGLDWR